MSLNFFTEPLYSLADFDRLFDDAFNTHTSGSQQVAHRDREGRHLCHLCPRNPLLQPHCAIARLTRSN